MPATPFNPYADTARLHLVDRIRDWGRQDALVASTDEEELEEVLAFVLWLDSARIAIRLEDPSAGGISTLDLQDLMVTSADVEVMMEVPELRGSMKILRMLAERPDLPAAANLVFADFLSQHDATRCVRNGPNRGPNTTCDPLGAGSGGDLHTIAASIARFTSDPELMLTVVERFPGASLDLLSNCHLPVGIPARALAALQATGDRTLRWRLSELMDAIVNPALDADTVRALLGELHKGCVDPDEQQSSAYLDMVDSWATPGPHGRHRRHLSVILNPAWKHAHLVPHEVRAVLLLNAAT